MGMVGLGLQSLGSAASRGAARKLTGVKGLAELGATGSLSSSKQRRQPSAALTTSSAPRKPLAPRGESMSQSRPPLVGQQRAMPGNRSQLLEAQIRAPLRPGPRVTTQRTDTPQAQSDLEIQTLQTDAYKRLLQGPGQAVTQGMAGLVNQYNTQYGAAKSANDARFQQMLGIADSTTQQRATDIRSQASQDITSQQQRLQRVGLGGTTVGNVLAGGIRKREQESLNTLADQMQQTKLGILGQMKEAYPDLAGVQSTLSNVAGNFEGGSGLPLLLQSLQRLQG